MGDGREQQTEQGPYLLRHINGNIVQVRHDVIVRETQQALSAVVSVNIPQPRARI
jgi:hypothetical protein